MPADRIFQILGFSPGEYSLKYTVSHIGMYHPKLRIWFLRFFGLKTGITLCSFWFGIGYGFRGKKRRITNVFVVSIPN